MQTNYRETAATGLGMGLASNHLDLVFRRFPPRQKRVRWTGLLPPA